MTGVYELIDKTARSAKAAMILAFLMLGTPSSEPSASSMDRRGEFLQGRSHLLKRD